LIVLGVAALVLAGCATSPARTADNLNRHDPAYRSHACRQARAAANDYAEEVNGRRVVALAGNLVVPFAGAAAAAAMTGIREDDAKALDRRVKASCISDPLRGRVARR
jgi:hypothetical protein